VATDRTVSNTEVNLKFYTCPHAEYTVEDLNGSVNIQLNGSYSELATLFYGTGEQEKSLEYQVVARCGDEGAGQI
jgi:hypothetical protein